MKRLPKNDVILEQQLRNGLLDSKEVTIEFNRETYEYTGNQMEQMMQIQLLWSNDSKKKTSRTVTVKEALELLTAEEAII